MNKLSIIVLSVTLAACSSSNTLNSNYKYNLMKNGQVLSKHTSFNDCNGASIRKNIRTVNEINSKHKTHQRVTQETASNIKAVCSKI